MEHTAKEKKENKESGDKRSRRRDKGKQRFFLISQAFFFILAILLIATVAHQVRNKNGTVFAEKTGDTGQVQQEALTEQEDSTEKETATEQEELTEKETAAAQEEPIETEDPVETEEPTETEEPMVTEEPVETEDSEVTEEAAVSEEPIVTEDPTVTEEPVVQETPQPQSSLQVMIRDSTQSITPYASQCEVMGVEPPQKMSAAAVEAKLLERTATNEKIAQIYPDRGLCPEKMLETLAKNPELADYVLEYINRKKNGIGEPNVSGSESATLTEEEKALSYPLFLQWDPRWAYKYYGNGNMGLTGCGPTSVSMALFYLTRDAGITPDVIGAYAIEHGYYLPGSGTLWSMIEQVPLVYGIQVRKPGISEAAMKQELDAGHVIICSMGPGDFTARGHFVVIVGYDDNGFWVNDPNCVARSKVSWPFGIIKGQIKQLWSLGN